MDESPISNPFDKDGEDNRDNPSYSSDLNPLDADTSSRSLAWMILGVAAMGCGLLVAVAVYFFRSDMQAAYNQYFPSPTATVTPIPTATSTPNLTATQKAAGITSTVQAVETLVGDAGNVWKVLITDSFDTVGSSWTTGNDDDDYATIIRRGVDRKYQWDATAKKGFVSWISANDKPLTDFYVSVEAQRVSGSSSSDYGLVFREDADSNFYYFGVSDEGFFVSVNYEDEWIDVVEFTFSSVVNAGDKNKISVIAREAYFIFLINDVIVAEAIDDHIPAGTTALAIQLHEAGVQAVIEFDNFDLRAP